jgi:predicted RNA binding protein YcfA (HicA-like mRNA interferase family)
MAARLANISGKQAVKAFQKFGWNVVGQVGSHVVMTKPGLRVNLSVPQHKEISIGLLRKLIKYADIEVDEFLGKCK